MAASGIAEWARTERLRRKWTQDDAVAELHRRTGHRLSRVWYSHIENGQEPSLEALLALQVIYGTAPDQQEDTLTRILVRVTALEEQVRLLVASVDRLGGSLPAEVRAQSIAAAEADVAEFLDELAANGPRPRSGSRRGRTAAGM